MYNTDFKHLQFLAETEWGLSHLKALLYKPHLGLWCSLSPETCEAFHSALKRHLENEAQLIDLLNLHLVTESLVFKDQAPEWFVSWVHEHIQVEKYLPEISWPAAVHGNWCATPVLLVHEQTYLRYFILGRVSAPNEIPLWPNWAEPLMDAGAKRGIRRAEKACRNLCPAKDDQRFVCYPLTIFNRMNQFRQTSLGLPVALGFMALLTGKSIPGELVATGSIQEDGSVRKVGHLSRKVKHARHMGFKVSLFPIDSHRPLGIDGMELLPVDNLRQAWMFARLFTPGRAADLILMGNMLKNPRAFVNNCTGLPVPWLEWALKNGLNSGIGSSMKKSPALFGMFVEKLGTCLDKGDFARGEALAEWVDSSIDNLKDASSPFLFKWYTLNLSVANHRGNTPVADLWQNKADAMVKNASVKDAESFATFYNHAFICQHHNRYNFHPELPPFLGRICHSLEGQYKSQCELVPDATNETLGALYGSIAQNFGFCGPEYLEETRTYCELSGKVYGCDNTPRQTANRLRPHNYLLYACLDAGRPDEAESTLLVYLEVDGLQALQADMFRFSAWHHAALARFFAIDKARNEMEKYVKWALDNKVRLIEPTHPWQLWLNNMGRVCYTLGDMKNARKFFRESLELCFSPTMGPTVQVMGLLPLSGLRRISAMEGSVADSVEMRIRALAKNLNPDHFRLLLENSDFLGTLDILWARPEVLFPFTYR